MSRQDSTPGFGMLAAGLVGAITLSATLAAAFLMFTEHQFSKMNAELPRLFEVFGPTSVTAIWAGIMLVEGVIWSRDDAPWRTTASVIVALAGSAFFLFLVLAALAPWVNIHSGLT